MCVCGFDGMWRAEKKKENFERAFFSGNAVCDTYSLALPSAQWPAASLHQWSEYFFFLLFHILICAECFVISLSLMEDSNLLIAAKPEMSESRKWKKEHKTRTNKSSGRVPFSLGFVESKHSTLKINITMAQTRKRQNRNGVTLKKKTDLRNMLYFITSPSALCVQNYSIRVHSWL